MSRTSRTPSTPHGPREDPQRGFASVDADESGERRRVRAERFADHYSQARLFWRSMSEPEQRHIVNAFTFELGKVETVADPAADARASGDHR